MSTLSFLKSVHHSCGVRYAHIHWVLLLVTTTRIHSASFLSLAGLLVVVPHRVLSLRSVSYRSAPSLLHPLFVPHNGLGACERSERHLAKRENMQILFKAINIAVSLGILQLNQKLI